jgi:uncharacterized membrane protein YagU involved in acid resistance
VQENVIVSHRGARFEIGRGPGFYAIWPAGAAQWRPIEWWPETPEGWQAAWARFTDVEPRRAIHPLLQPALVPAGPDAAAIGQSLATSQAVAGERTIVEGEPIAAQQPASTAHLAPASPSPGPGQSPDPDQPDGSGLPLGLGQPPAAAPPPADRKAGFPATIGRAGRPNILAAALLAAGIVVGIAGLFPGYFGGTGLASHAEELVPHLIYLAAWALGAALIVQGGNRARTGALLAAGTSLVTFGLFLADLGTGISAGDVGTGLVLGIIGWAACTAGSVLAVRQCAVGAPGKPRSLEIALTVALAAVAALGTAIAFAPSWDTFTLRTAAGTSQTITAGNVFANPGLVIAGDVLVMVAVVAVVLVAATWRPIRLGAALLAGAIVPMAAQAISAVIPIGQSTSSLQFGIPPAQAARLGLTIDSGLTPAFWVFSAFVFALILTAALMLSTPTPPPPPPTPVPGRLGQPGMASPPTPAVG